ncbi:MAG: hypothetical protein QN424_08460, partial [Nitrososphaeraceae archaeon]|nr:hypothetical protein [Nitrososphaeraceae archaeon]
SASIIMRANFVSDIVSVIETELNGYGTTSSLSRRKCKKLEQEKIKVHFCSESKYESQNSMDTSFQRY